MTFYEQGCLAAQLLCGLNKTAAAELPPTVPKQILKTLHDALSGPRGDYYVRIPLHATLGGTTGALVGHAMDLDPDQQGKRTLAGAAAGGLTGAAAAAFPTIKETLKTLTKVH